MIAMHYIEGRYIPVMICDICEKRIIDGPLAAVIHRDGKLGEAELLPCMHVHKGKCLDSAERKFGGANACGWQELQTHLLYLVLNSKFTPEMLAAERDNRDAAGSFE